MGDKDGNMNMNDVIPITTQAQPLDTKAAGQDSQPAKSTSRRRAQVIEPLL